MKKNTENNELFENIENEQVEDFGIEEEPRKNRKKGLMVAYAAVMFVALIGVGVLFTSGVGNASAQNATPTPTVTGTPKATPKATSTPKATPKPTDKAKKKAADTATPGQTETVTPQENTAGAENTASGNGNAVNSGAVSTGNNGSSGSGSSGGGNTPSTPAPSTPEPEKPHVHGDGCGHTWVPAKVEKVWVVDAPATPDTQEPIYGADVVCSCGQHFSSTGAWGDHAAAVGRESNHSYSVQEKITGYNTIPGTPEQGHWEERIVSDGYWK